MKEARLTVDDWNRAVAEAMEAGRKANGKGKTMAELSSISGKSVGMVKRALQSMKAEGKLVVSKDYREALDNSMRLVTTYSVKK